MKIRTHLIVLVLASIWPVLLFAGVATAVFWQQQRALLEQRYQERVRAMALALDRQIDGYVGTLTALASAPELDAGNLRRFYNRARRVLAAENEWSTILLFDATGRQLLDLSSSVGAPMTAALPPKDGAVDHVLASGRPAVSGLIHSPATGKYATAVAVPVARDGRVKHVLAAVIDPAVWLGFLASIPVAPEATMTLLDQNRTIIARTLNNDRSVGRRPAPALDENAARWADAAYRSVGMEGQQFYSAHSRARTWGWTVATGVPVHSAEAALWRSTLAMGSGAIAAGVLAVAFAVLFGRRITEAVSALVERAGALASGRPIPPPPPTDVAEIAGVARAFTEASQLLRAREAALREERERTRAQLAEIAATYRTAPVGLCVLDRELRFVRINERMAEINGLPAAEHIGRTVREITPALADAVEPMLQRVIETGESLLDVEISGETPARPGVRRTWLQSSFPLRAGGAIIGVNVVAEEITERKRVEEERARLLASAQAARAEAEAANRAKDEFLAVLSHELRTPLTAMLGWIRMLRGGHLPPEKTDLALETIERNTRMQAQLINDLLDVSRIIAGKMQLNKLPLDLAAMVARVVDAFRRETEAKSIEVVTELNPAAGPVLGDLVRLEQILTNIVSNAVKFTPPGGRIDVAVERWGEWARIVVGDTGPGIAPEVLPHVFEPFRQGETTSRRGYEGLGLGLAIVHHLVEMHGGRVRAESAGIGKGTTIVVELPIIAVRVPEQDEPATVTAAAAGDGAPRLDGLAVLVVEDHADSRDMIATALEARGATCVAVGSVPDAMTALASSRFDLLVSDLAMPGRDGFDLVEWLRAREHAAGTPPMPAIALSAFVSAEDRERALSLGFNRHVAKPIEPIELVAVVAELAGVTPLLARPRA
jgi:PAS domain S-box-containing protein